MIDAKCKKALEKLVKSCEKDEEIKRLYCTL